MHDNLEGSGFIHICAFLFPPLELTAHRNLQKYPNCRVYFAMHGFHPSHIAADLRIAAERRKRVSGKRKGEVTTDSDAWISRGRKRQLSILVVSLSTIFVLLFFGLLLIFFWMYGKRKDGRRVPCDIPSIRCSNLYLNPNSNENIGDSASYRWLRSGYSDTRISFISTLLTKLNRYIVSGILHSDDIAKIS